MENKEENLDFAQIIMIGEEESFYNRFGRAEAWIASDSQY